MPQTVFITGCSSGLGRATALDFAHRGWNVVATMRQPENSSDFATLDNVLVTKLDVENEDSIQAAFDSALERFNSIDVLINNAGFGLFGLFETTSPEKVKQQFDVNVFGAMATIRVLLPYFRFAKAGIIVNVSSGAGVFGLPALSLYCASKFALEGFSEALSYELASQGIKVKIVEPGGVLSTSFGKRSGEEAAGSGSLPSYASFMAHTAALFDNMRSGPMGTEEQVTECIYTAVTDGTDQLRYVATDDIKPLIHARRETSETEYMALMRSLFAG
jgi:NAD(P)-dependent dehydrogenase (short-subunit alcohol dehydrogenase family)